ncbi:cyclase family protein [Acidisoma sp. S159]|jgi:kynurenine formamidase|uniref:cyclase family protein n=1 Tax=Acidisoma sp. S159 TaxID=1747225 RepID=UPI00131C3665|nr:cyclase family protein [Acidisoma sp. S159]
MASVPDENENKSTRRATVFDVPLDLLRKPSLGKAYDLSSGWWPGMPLAAGHPPFQLLTYRSPRGQRNQKDLRFLDKNKFNFGFISEMMCCTTHTGTHIDALSHITSGPSAAWHGGFSSDDHLGDFGPLNNDAAALPPLIRRGLMLDIPAALGLDQLAPHQPVDGKELEQACVRQGVEPREGDFVLVRTGTMREWPDPVGMSCSQGCGLSIDGARWLVTRGVTAIGGDNAALEVEPSGVEGDFQPVHRYVIQECGLLILEWVNPEELARDEIFEFLFLCLPLTVSGATGSMVRPLAVI